MSFHGILTFYTSKEGYFFLPSLNTNTDVICFIFQKIEIKFLFFHFYFFNPDLKLTIVFTTLQLCSLIENVHLEGTVSQIFNLGPSFCFMSKTGNFLLFFATKFSRLNKIKTKA